MTSITPMTPERWELMFGVWYVPEPNTGCWLWMRGACRGYGVLKSNGVNRGAHSVSYEMLRGPIPDGLELDHLCRQPLCVNPDHLEPVTHAVNMSRGAIANKTHCKRGHPLSGEHVITYAGKTPRKRCCIVCHRMHRSAWWERQSDERKAEIMARQRIARRNRRARSARSRTRDRARAKARSLLSDTAL